MQSLKLDKTFIFILCIGITLTLQMSWVSGFFADGYLYAAFGKSAANFDRWLVPGLSDATIPYFNHHSPFLFILEGLFFKATGVSYTSARIFAAFFTLATGWALYRAVREHKSWAYLSLLIFFVTPPLLKKTRFPNMDIAIMLMTFLALFYYGKAFRLHKLRDWLLCGLFFGFAALVKGPMCAVIPLIILIHLLVEKKSKVLLSMKPWLGLILGLGLFSLWPMSLYLSDRLDIFKQWVDFTFLITIRDSRGTSSPFWTYGLFLLKYTGPLVLLASYASFKSFKEKKSHTLLKLYAISFLVILLSLSLTPFKYSNYLIPIYPFMALLAAKPISERWDQGVLSAFKYVDLLAIVLAMVLLIFPLTNKTKRDQEIFKVKSFIQHFNFKPDNWIVVGQAYSYWPLMSLNYFEDSVDTIQVPDHCEKLEKKIRDKSIVLVGKDNLERVKKILPGYITIAHSQKGNFYVLTSKRYFHFNHPLAF